VKRWLHKDGDGFTHEIYDARLTKPQKSAGAAETVAVIACRGSDTEASGLAARFPKIAVAD
jgi:hypothetical protein